MWKPVDGFDLEEAAMNAVISDKNTYVVAGPGAGKTELLAQRASYLLETNRCRYPRKILAISFKKDAAKNLAARVEKRCGKELGRRFVSLTYDAFAKGLLDRFYRALPKIYQLSCPTYDVIISNKDIISNQAEINSFRFLTLPLILMWAWIFLREVISAQCLSTFGGINSELEHRYGERCLVSSMAVQKLPLGTLNDDRLLWKAVFQVWQILLKESPRLTFQMISRLSEYLIRCNPLIRQCLILTYSHIFLDEFQDTTTIQL